MYRMLPDVGVWMGHKVLYTWQNTHVRHLPHVLQAVRAQQAQKLQHDENLRLQVSALQQLSLIHI